MYCMRVSKTVSVTIPPELLAKAQQAAAREHRTMSELVREALQDLTPIITLLTSVVLVIGVVRGFAR